MGLRTDEDNAWLIFGAVLVIFMHAGFTMLEVGSVAAKNTKSILSKNLIGISLGAICWYFVGYAFAFGDDSGDGWIGQTGFGGTGTGLTVQQLNDDGSHSENRPYEDGAWWVFQFSFCATAATIVSGAVAERCDLRAYFVYTSFITSLVYPVVAHWAWGPDGWAQAIEADGKTVSVIDFAGSGVVHMTGGAAALVGAIVLGPRTGRFENDDNNWGGQNATFQTLGTLILWVGWYGFNCVSTGAINGGNGPVAGHVAMTTTLSAAAGGITSFLLGRMTTGSWDPVFCNNGILGGLVGITAGCAVVEPYGAFFIGVIAGLIYFGASNLLVKLRVDDVVDASPVHFFCGIWGVIAPGLFGAESNYCGVFYENSYYSFANGTQSGQLYRDCGDTQGPQLAAQISFAVAVTAWAGITSLVVFVFLKMIGILRVSLEEEEAGLDTQEHGGGAYDGAVRKPSFRKAGSDTPTAAGDVEAALELGA